MLLVVAQQDEWQIAISMMDHQPDEAPFVLVDFLISLPQIVS